MFDQNFHYMRDSPSLSVALVWAFQDELQSWKNGLIDKWSFLLLSTQGLTVVESSMSRVCLRLVYDEIESDLNLRFDDGLSIGEF